MRHRKLMRLNIGKYGSKAVPGDMLLRLMESLMRRFFAAGLKNSPIALTLKPSSKRA